MRPPQPTNALLCSLLATLAACASSAQPSPTPKTLAVSTQAALGDTAPLGKIVRVEMPRQARWRLIAYDDKGRVAVKEHPRTSFVVLPFPKPVRQVHGSSEPHPGAYCARTMDDSLACLHVGGSLTHFLAKAERHARIASLEFPALQGVIARLLQRPGLCFVTPTGTRQCLATSHLGQGKTLRLRFVDAGSGAEVPWGDEVGPTVVWTSTDRPGRLLPTPIAAVRCSIAATHQVMCRGPGVYGELGDGSLAAENRTATVSGLVDAVELAAGDRFVCARTRNGAVACWGRLPKKLLDVADASHHPLCAIDRPGIEARHREAMAKMKQRVATCMGTPCTEGELDCHLGCVERPVPRELVFVRGPQPCEEPTARGDRLWRDWPRPEQVSTAARIHISAEPRALEATGIVSIAARDRTLCATSTAGVVTCWSDD